jgi:hypothetical protein
MAVWPVTPASSLDDPSHMGFSCSRNASRAVVRFGAPVTRGKLSL